MNLCWWVGRKILNKILYCGEGHAKGGSNIKEEQKKQNRLLEIELKRGQNIHMGVFNVDIMCTCKTDNRIRNIHYPK